MMSTFASPSSFLTVDAGVGLGAMFDPRTDVKLQSMLQTFRDGMERSLKVELAKKDEEITSLKASVTKLEKLLRSMNSEIEDRDCRLSLIDSYDGSMVRKLVSYTFVLPSLPAHAKRYRISTTIMFKDINSPPPPPPPPPHTHTQQGVSDRVCFCSR